MGLSLGALLSYRDSLKGASFMTLLRNFAVGFVLCALSGCGGGSGGGVNSAPPPPPPPPVYNSFGNLTTDQQVSLSGVTFSRTDTITTTSTIVGATTVTARPFSEGSLSITYNAATNGYTIRSGTNSQTFAPADIRPNLEINGPAFVNYGRADGPDGAVNAILSIYRPAGGGGDVALTYTTLAQWARVNDDPPSGTPTTRRSDSFWGVGGFPTLASDMPRTGGATYNGPLRGTYVQGTTIDSITGQVSLFSDFAAGTVKTDLYLNRIGFSTLVVGGTGTIQGVRFSGNLNDGAYTGVFDGGFFGPQAAEMGLSFTISDNAGPQIGGVGAGRR
jgi:hypothetical protein